MRNNADIASETGEILIVDLAVTSKDPCITTISILDSVLINTDKEL